MQIAVNGISLEYQELGPALGAPLVLIRGLGTQMVHWPRALIDGFVERGYRVVIFDNRDAGLSARCPAEGVSGKPEDILATVAAGEQPAAAYTLEDMALDVIGLMDGLGIEKAHVFGISMGGGIAQVLAVNHAARLLSDTMVMTSAGLRDPSLLPQILAYPETRDEAVESWLKGHADCGSHGYPMSEAEIRAEAAMAWDRAHDAEGVNRQLLAIMATPDRQAALKAVSLPCLVIHGAIDTLIPPAAGEHLAALIPNARLEIVDGMGHFITPRLAPRIVEMVDGFIAGLPGSVR